ncbi:MAG: MerR family transcriptional regulator [Oscillospiraceae bacterium]
MVKTYTTSEVAEIIGIHPNTVRRYEELDLISKPERLANGYRVFIEEHLLQFRLARAAFEVEILQSGLRNDAIAIVKTTALRRYSEALRRTEEYLAHIRGEQENAEEAIAIARGFHSGIRQADDGNAHTRKEIADLLNITIDTLRNWELNGLLTVKRKQNGYRVYNEYDMRILKIIRTLRLANYSLAAILRMLKALEDHPGSDMRDVIDTPGTDEDIISVCDRLLSSLMLAEQNAGKMTQLLQKMKNRDF